MSNSYIRSRLYIWRPEIKRTEGLFRVLIQEKPIILLSLTIGLESDSLREKYEETLGKRVSQFPLLRR